MLIGSDNLSSAHEVDEARDLPLVIDLDGTLIRTNSRHETLLDALRAHPLSLSKLLVKLAVGRSAVKEFLAGHSPLDVGTWPVRQDFVEYLQDQAQAGRRIVLVTAADQSVANAVAERFPFISEVIALSSGRNMEGIVKARHLLERFPRGFIYAGDSAADLAIWREGARSILVDAPSSVVRRAERMSAPLAIFPRPPFNATSLRRALRVHQWAKNLLIFVPLILGGRAGEAEAWFNALLGFVALGLAASATYIVNDLWDLPNDRRHSSKRLRPLASGALSIRDGVLLVIIGLVGAFAVAGSIGLAALAMLALYVAVALSYSFYFKRFPIVDVFILASLFTLRLGFGVVITDVRLSPWLLVFSMFVFLSLSLAKRHTEVVRLVERELDAIPGRGYVARDAPLTLTMGVASTLAAVFLMVLYLIEDAFPRPLYANPEFLWAIPPTLFLFLGRIWVLSQRGQLHDDPVAFALKDRASLLLGLLMGIAMVAAMGSLGVP